MLRYDTPFMSARYALEGLTAEELDPAKLADRREVSLKSSSATLSESFLGTSALIRQGADFIAEEHAADMPQRIINTALN